MPASNAAPYTQYLYTGEHPTRDVRLAGSMRAIIDVAGHLHERTPFVHVMFYPNSIPPRGIAFVRVDDRGHHSTMQLAYAITAYAEGEKLDRLRIVEDMRLLKDPLLLPFRVKMYEIPAYVGAAPIIKYAKHRLDPTKIQEMLASPKTRYIMFGDTTDAQIAQALAPYFPVYCYEGQTTVITYVCFPNWKAYDLWASTKLPQDLTIYKSVNLPYESTISISPQKRAVEVGSIFD